MARLTPEENCRVSQAKPEVAPAIFRPIAGGYDLFAEVFSFGQNRKWRTELVSRAAPEAALTLDVATGTAGVALELADRIGGNIVGVDLVPEMLKVGRRKVRAAGLIERITLLSGRAEQLPFGDATFDGLTFTYLMRYVEDPAVTLRELVRVVRPGGRIASLEFHVPPRVHWRLLWWAYTRTALPLLGALAGKGWFRVGRFLGPSISGFYRRYPLGKQLDFWRNAGLEGVGCRLMSLGGGVVMWGTKAGG